MVKNSKILVAGGTGFIGGDMDTEACLAGTQDECAPLLMGRFPVTVMQYLTYLNDRRYSNIQNAQARQPRAISSRPWFTYDEASQTFALDPEAEPTMILGPRSPLSGITHDDERRTP